MPTLTCTAYKWLVVAQTWLICHAASTAGVIHQDTIAILPLVNTDSVALQHLVRISGSDDYLLFGFANAPGLSAVDQPAPRGGIFATRVDSSGQIVYFRYLPGMVDCWGVALGRGDDIWVLLVPDPQNPLLDSIAVTNDLDPTFEYTSFSTLYLARLAGIDGSIQSITRMPSTWIGKPAETLSPRMLIDSNGRIWIGGYGSGGKLPVTADAADNIPYIPGRVGPGTLLRLSPDAGRIEYATYLQGDAVAALAHDRETGAIYAAGDRVWKISADGQMLWSTWLPPGAALAATYNLASGLFIAGCTTSLQPFPTTEGAFQRETAEQNPRERFPPYYPKLCVDGFVARFSSEGDLIYSTLIGGPGKDVVNFVSADDGGNATVSGNMLISPGTTKSLFWAPLGASEFVARLNPQGSEVDFFTSILFGTGAGTLASPSSSVEGTLTFARIQYSEQHRSISLYQVSQSAPAILPRIDYLVRSNGESSTNAYRLDLRGEGFGEQPEVLLDGMPLVAIPDPSTGLLKVALFVPPPPQPDAFRIAEGTATYKLTVRNSDGQESSPVLLVLVRSSN
jgi:hypothetical protein